ncbi:MAG: urate hydroxylase PuuD [Gammaproteobacteria bacterium]|nr:urate hydroxylase PuuD [Gammaproteobacteria bacterium]MBT8444692.1 urate hydroxylase PuuD [Gammaproteobacteria bacterium]
MNPLKSIWGTIISGLVIAAAIAIAATSVGMADSGAVVILIHVAVGITWIGLLYYFNFVQVPGLADAAADEGGPGGAGISKYIAPRALLWFRWAAVVTWLTGAVYLLERGEFLNAFLLGNGSKGDPVYGLTIGVGAWMGTIMLFNVWVLIWPNQKKVLGIVEASAEEIGKAKSTALMASRTNTMLSIPMLMSMVGAHHGYFL